MKRLGRRGILKLGAAAGLLSVLPFSPKSKIGGVTMGMPLVQTYRIVFSNETTRNVEFTREEIGPAGTVSFYRQVGSTIEEKLVMRVSPHNYLRMVNVTP